MSFSALIAIIETETDAEVCARIEARFRQELGGLSLYVPTRRRVSRKEILREVRATAGDVDRAAHRLNLHRSTVYRKLRPEPGPRLPGTTRTVR